MMLSDFTYSHDFLQQVLRDKQEDWGYEKEYWEDRPTHT